MNLEEKMAILTSAAKYDVSCSSSGSSRKNKGGLGDAHLSGICHSWSKDGRCISLLKLLQTNYCIYDCTYCVNRNSNDLPRAVLTPEEIAELTINFYRRNYIEGLFLSSAIFHSPNKTMELLYRTVKLLRETYNFHGYIHLKAIPGSDQSLLTAAGQLVDRMSVNIELPSEASLRLLAPQKNKLSIIKPMEFLQNKIEHKERKFLPAGQTTQLIIGASPDSDLKIISLSENLYRKYRLKRVYYSAFVPIVKHHNLPAVSSPPLLREHRLYQADWLLRFYGFKAAELLNAKNPNLDVKFDPKTNWALNNIQHFPLEINKADYHDLIRIPGIGMRSAQRIVMARKMRTIQFEDLKKLGVSLKRAGFFITCNGKMNNKLDLDIDKIKMSLSPKPLLSTGYASYQGEQLTIFTDPQRVLSLGEIQTPLTGEL